MKSHRLSKFTVRMLLLALLAILPNNQAVAVPANPEAATVKQPNRRSIRVFLRGDEHLHWNEDEKGYTILKEKPAGPWVYAIKDAAGKLIGSRKIVGEADPATLGVPKRLLPAGAVSHATASARTRTSANPDGVAPKAPLTGTMKNLVLLVAFSDKAITNTTAEFNALFNTVGYTTGGAQGSMKDYYNEVSYNQLNVDSVVVEPVTLTNGYAYYGANDVDGYDLRPREMVQQALAALDARGFDFSTLDNDSDGWVDGLTVIHAGGGEEYGGNDENYIWSHQWELSSYVTYDGKKLQVYHTEPARRGWDSTPSSQGITRIGVICHENGHFLGLPDLYDYDYDSEGAGEFCLMAGGSWNGDNGTQPAHMSAWCKTSLAWLNATTVTATGTYTVPQVEDNQTIFRLSGAFPSSQYFLVENRQGYGFDASMPGSTRGLLIWHVDEAQSNNDDQTHYMVDLEEASGTQHLQSTNNAGDDADYFRTGTMTTFTSNTTPNNRSYSGVALGLDITAVSASGTSMTFTVGSSGSVSITGNPLSRTNVSGTSASFTVTATGASPLYYQWQKESTNIALATNATYSIASVATNDAGNYRCKVSNAVNVATSEVAVLTVVSAAPASIWASATNSTDFTAAWSSVSGATGYRLDVGTNATFSGGGSSVQSVLASNGATAASIVSDGWTAYDISGTTYAQLLKSSSVVTSPAFSTVGFTNLTMDMKARTYGGTSGTSSNITVSISTNDGTSWTVMGVVAPWVNSMNSLPTLTNTANLGHAQTRIRWQTLGATGSAGVGITNLVVQGWSAGGAPAYVPGYSNRTVAGTSQSVTGLTESTTYYFRARAVSGGGTSTNSATASVTTLEGAEPGTPPTMDAIPAQTAYVGGELECVVTAQEPDSDPVTFACTSAVDVATWDVDANTGDFLFIPTTNEMGTNVFSFTATDKDGTSAAELMSVKVYSAAATNEFTQWVEDQEEDPVDPDFAASADVDGDGQTTYDEFLADTDPAASNSVLKMEGLSADLDQFSFPASPARYYQLEYCTDITNQAGTLVVSNLGWGVPGMVITNTGSGSWYGVIRVLLDAP